MIYGLVGTAIGAAGGFLVIFANQNYERTAEFAPVLAASLAFIAFFAVTTVLGLILVLFRRKGMLFLALGQFLGLGIGSIAYSISGAAQ